MRYYPVNLDVENRSCLVVGGGSVGTRKVKTLVDCGARVTVVGKEIREALIALAENGKILVRQRAYVPSDLEGVFLVIGATDDEALNRRIRQDADSRGVLCNIADRPELCHFILPAVVRRGDLIVAISTSGKSPALAKQLRERLEAFFGPEYGPFLELMGEVRTRLLSQAHDPEAHKPLFEQLISGRLMDWIREGRTREIDLFLAEVLGEGWNYDSLSGKGNRADHRQSSSADGESRAGDSDKGDSFRRE